MNKSIHFSCAVLLLINGIDENNSQVVGWPPVGAHRLSSLVNNQTKSPRSGDDEKVGSEKDNTKSNTKDASKKKICNNGNVFSNEKTHLGFVKVNMDGLPIGRKVDLNAHASYDTLAQALEDMFFNNSKSINLIGTFLLILKCILCYTT